MRHTSDGVLQSCDGAFGAGAAVDDFGFALPCAAAGESRTMEDALAAGRDAAVLGFVPALCDALADRLCARARISSSARCCACSSLNESVSASERRLLRSDSHALSDTLAAASVEGVGVSGLGLTASSTRCFFAGGAPLLLRLVAGARALVTEATTRFTVISSSVLSSNTIASAALSVIDDSLVRTLPGVNS